MCPGCVHSRINSRVAKCASDGVGGGRGFHVAQLWRIPVVYGEDKEKFKLLVGSSANKGGKVCKVDALLPRHAK